MKKFLEKIEFYKNMYEFGPVMQRQEYSIIYQMYKEDYRNYLANCFSQN